mgnify:CR=1 FL=1
MPVYHEYVAAAKSARRMYLTKANAPAVAASQLKSSGSMSTTANASASFAVASTVDNNYETSAVVVAVGVTTESDAKYFATKAKGIAYDLKHNIGSKGKKSKSKRGNDAGPSIQAVSCVELMATAVEHCFNTPHNSSALSAGSISLVVAETGSEIVRLSKNGFASDGCGAGVPVGVGTAKGRVRVLTQVPLDATVVLTVPAALAAASAQSANVDTDGSDSESDLELESAGDCFYSSTDSCSDDGPCGYSEHSYGWHRNGVLLTKHTLSAQLHWLSDAGQQVSAATELLLRHAGAVPTAPVIDATSIASFNSDDMNIASCSSSSSAAASSHLSDAGSKMLLDGSIFRYRSDATLTTCLALQWGLAHSALPCAASLYFPPVLFLLRYCALLYPPQLFAFILSSPADKLTTTRAPKNLFPSVFGFSTTHQSGDPVPLRDALCRAHYARQNDIIGESPLAAAAHAACCFFLASTERMAFFALTAVAKALEAIQPLAEDEDEGEHEDDEEEDAADVVKRAEATAKASANASSKAKSKSKANAEIDDDLEKQTDARKKLAKAAGVSARHAGYLVSVAKPVLVRVRLTAEALAAAALAADTKEAATFLINNNASDDSSSHNRRLTSANATVVDLNDSTKGKLVEYAASFVSERQGNLYLMSMLLQDWVDENARYSNSLGVSKNNDPSSRNDGLRSAVPALQVVTVSSGIAIRGDAKSNGPNNTTVMSQYRDILTAALTESSSDAITSTDSTAGNTDRKRLGEGDANNTPASASSSESSGSADSITTQNVKRRRIVTDDDDEDDSEDITIIASPTTSSNNNNSRPGVLTVSPELQKQFRQRRLDLLDQQQTQWEQQQLVKYSAICDPRMLNFEIKHHGSQCSFFSWECLSASVTVPTLTAIPRFPQLFTADTEIPRLITMVGGTASVSVTATVPATYLPLRSLFSFSSMSSNANLDYITGSSSCSSSSSSSSASASATEVSNTTCHATTTAINISPSILTTSTTASHRHPDEITEILSETLQSQPWLLAASTAEDAAFADSLLQPQSLARAQRAVAADCAAAAAAAAACIAALPQTTVMGKIDVYSAPAAAAASGMSSATLAASAAAAAKTQAAAVTATGSNASSVLEAERKRIVRVLEQVSRSYSVQPLNNNTNNANGSVPPHPGLTSSNWAGGLTVMTLPLFNTTAGNCKPQHGISTNIYMYTNSPYGASLGCRRGSHYLPRWLTQYRNKDGFVDWFINTLALVSEVTCPGHVSHVPAPLLYTAAPVSVPAFFRDRQQRHQEQLQALLAAKASRNSSSFSASADARSNFDVLLSQERESALGANITNTNSNYNYDSRLSSGSGAVTVTVSVAASVSVFCPFVRTLSSFSHNQHLLAASATAARAAATAAAALDIYQMTDASVDQPAFSAVSVWAEAHTLSVHGYTKTLSDLGVTGISAAPFVLPHRLKSDQNDVSISCMETTATVVKLRNATEQLSLARRSAVAEDSNIVNDNASVLSELGSSNGHSTARGSGIDNAERERKSILRNHSKLPKRLNSSNNFAPVHSQWMREHNVMDEASALKRTAMWQQLYHQLFVSDVSVNKYWANDYTDIDKVRTDHSASSQGAYMAVSNDCLSDKSLPTTTATGVPVVRALNHLILSTEHCGVIDSSSLNDQRDILTTTSFAGLGTTPFLTHASLGTDANLSGLAASPAAAGHPHSLSMPVLPWQRCPGYVRQSTTIVTDLCRIAPSLALAVAVAAAINIGTRATARAAQRAQTTLCDAAAKVNREKKYAASSNISSTAETNSRGNDSGDEYWEANVIGQEYASRTPFAVPMALLLPVTMATKTTMQLPTPLAMMLTKLNNTKETQQSLARGRSQHEDTASAGTDAVINTVPDSSASAVCKHLTSLPITLEPAVSALARFSVLATCWSALGMLLDPPPIPLHHNPSSSSKSTRKQSSTAPKVAFPTEVELKCVISNVITHTRATRFHPFGAPLALVMCDFAHAINKETKHAVDIKSTSTRKWLDAAYEVEQSLQQLVVALSYHGHWRAAAAAAAAMVRWCQDAVVHVAAALDSRNQRGVLTSGTKLDVAEAAGEYKEWLEQKQQEYTVMRRRLSFQVRITLLCENMLCHE